MSSYIVTVKDTSKHDEVKETLRNEGFEIVHEYTIIPAFSVKLPGDKVTSLETLKGHHDAIDEVEADQEVSIQK